MSEKITETIPAETNSVPVPHSIEDIKPKMKLSGVVKRLELYGAFIDIGIGVNALIHISQLGKERVNRVSDVLNLEETVDVWVLKIDSERNQVMLTMVEPYAVDWSDLKKGAIFTGHISRIENFGAFVEIGAEREGLVHISEISHEYVKHPNEALKVGDEKEVQVLGFSKRKRRIDLSIKALLDKPESETTYSTNPRTNNQEHIVEEFEEDDLMPTAMEIAMREAMGDKLPVRSRKSKKRKNRRAKARAQQEDILSRTLQVQTEA